MKESNHQIPYMNFSAFFNFHYYYKDCEHAAGACAYLRADIIHSINYVL